MAINWAIGWDSWLKWRPLYFGPMVEFKSDQISPRESFMYVDPYIIFRFNNENYLLKNFKPLRLFLNFCHPHVRSLCKRIKDIYKIFTKSYVPLLFNSTLTSLILTKKIRKKIFIFYAPLQFKVWKYPGWIRK